MPEDTKKSQQRKGKSDPKDQRKPRQARFQATSSQQEKKPENKIPSKLETPKAPEKPVYEEPGPEFYKNLKRETDEILKITEEANSKYKKKEIQSNWGKYELPIESYEDVEEQENMGADYEKLIEGSQIIGGHFQFKHEKSWDINTGPSLYDKYFEIDMDNLSLAVQTIPFYERNAIEESIFSETDKHNMNNRSMRYKRKYFKDESITTPELETQAKIIQSLKTDDPKVETRDIKKENTIQDQSLNSSIKEQKREESGKKEILKSSEPILDVITLNVNENQLSKNENVNNISLEQKDDSIEKNDSSVQTITATVKPDIQTITAIVTDISLLDNGNPTKVISKVTHEVNKSNKSNPIDDITQKTARDTEGGSQIEPETARAATSPSKEQKQPVIESPEDLEKWLDDFLDG